MNLETIYRRDQSFVFRDIAGETILVPIRQHVGDLDDVFRLNAVASFTWNHLDGRRNLGAINQLIVEAFDVSAEVTETDLMEFMSQLLEIDAVREVTTWSAPTSPN